MSEKVNAFGSKMLIGKKISKVFVNMCDSEEEDEMDKITLLFTDGTQLIIEPKLSEIGDDWCPLTARIDLGF